MIDLKLTLKPIDILRMGIILTIIGAIIIGLNFFPKYTFLPFLSYSDYAFPVEPNSTNSVNIGFFPKGQVFVGKINVLDVRGWSNGGEPSQILAELRDSSGNTILRSTLVDGNYSFPFEASKDDNYYLNFDNANPSLNKSSYERKWILWQIWYYGNYTIIFQISASILWTSGIISIGIYLFKKREQPAKRAEVIPALPEKKTKKDETSGFRDFCYCYFKRFGCALSHVFKDVGKDLDIANMKIHPEVYFSVLSFFAIVSLVVPVFFFLFFLSLGALGWINPILWMIFGSLPLLVILIGLLIPKTVASNRVSGLQIEVPYASMYLSVMVSGGLSPYACLMRLRQTSLLPKLREEIKRIQDRILSSGSDPISIIEKSAKDVGLKEYKDLFLGYASATKTGGDIVHYLYIQTESMFRSLATKIKAVGELMSTLMETYMIVGILGTLGLYMMFIISMSAPTGVTLSQESFFLFAFVVLPIISFVFLYLADLLCIKYPSSNSASYIALAASAPLGIFLATQMALSFFYPMLLVLPSLQSFPAYLQSVLSFEQGCEPALGLAISLAVIAIPVLIVDGRYSMEEKGVLQGITSFLREMTENRKSGLSPEKCFRVLSKNDYGKFSKHLKTISSQIGWGFPMRKIIEDFKKKVKNWLAQINIYLLIDTIMVGGGNEESLEALAEFSETSNALEKERKAMLTPLLIVPFIGALLLIVTTMMFIQFFSSMSTLAQPLIPLLTLSRILITPLILHCFLLGLVTGKTVSGRVSSGFKTGMYLLVLSIIGIWVSSRLTMFAQFGGG